MCRHVNPIISNQARYSDIYSRTYIAAHYPFGIRPPIHQICIHGCTYYPQLSTFIYTYVKHVNIPVTTTNTPLDRRLDGHALTAHTYRSVEAYRSTSAREAFRLYLSTDRMVIGSALIHEFEGKECVIYYLSRRLIDAAVTEPSNL